MEDDEIFGGGDMLGGKPKHEREHHASKLWSLTRERGSLTYDVGE